MTEGQTTSDIDFSLRQGGIISGMVYQNDGVTPVTDASIRIQAVQGDPCAEWTFTMMTTTKSDGTYTLVGMPAGTYYVRTDNKGESDYVNEWWAAAGSSKHCATADPVEIAWNADRRPPSQRERWE